MRASSFMAESTWLFLYLLFHAFPSAFFTLPHAGRAIPANQARQTGGEPCGAALQLGFQPHG